MSTEDDVQLLIRVTHELNANISVQNDRLHEFTGVLVDIHAILEQIERSMNSIARSPR